MKKGWEGKSVDDRSGQVRKTLAVTGWFSKDERTTPRVWDVLMLIPHVQAYDAR